MLRLLKRMAYILPISLPLVGDAAVSLSLSSRAQADSHDLSLQIRIAAIAPFVNESDCALCHKDKAEIWSRSHHAKAMARVAKDDLPASITTQMDFGDVRFRLRNAGDKNLFELDEDGRRETREVLYSFGIWPLQQFLVQAPGGRLQVWPIGWDAKNERWFVVRPDAMRGDDSAMRWTGVYQNWNAMCAECHSTGVVKNYDRELDSYKTQMQAINVGCQACHGPGGAHVDWARRTNVSSADPYRSAAGHRQNSVELCATCHSVRTRIAAPSATPSRFLDEFSPALLTPGLYHADGQQDGEVFVYGSFLQSSMYAKGVVCTDCHDPHSSKLRAPGNQICTQCHSASADRRRPDLPARDYNANNHSHHSSDGAGASCASCHMPPKVYMALQDRPDHSFRSPRPDLTEKIGTPNACNRCHEDKNAAWAAAKIDEWFSQKEKKEHYGEILYSARNGDYAAGPRLARLAAAGAAPSIVRATALALLGNYPDNADRTIESSSRDAEPLIRLGAVLGARGLAAARRAAILKPLLNDSFRSVRIEAARNLADLPASAFSGGDAVAFSKALEEYIEAQTLNSDMPAALMNLGWLRMAQGNTKGAQAEFRAAITKDPLLTPARIALAKALALEGQAKESRSVLEDGVNRHPANGELRYALALKLAETGSIRAASDEFQVAVKLLPDDMRARLEFALALHKLGRTANAAGELESAIARNPSNVQSVYVLTVLYAELSRWGDAARQLARLRELRPADPKLDYLAAWLAQRQNRSMLK